MKAPAYLLLPTLLILGGVSAVVRANDIYIAQTPVGLANGQGCANALTPEYVNLMSHWTTSPPVGGQIGPGTKIHLCGIFNGTAGGSLLTVAGDGNATNPVTIQFEPGAQLNAPYWGNIVNEGCPCAGAITINGHNYITIDGGGTGIIQNTANGSSLPNQKGSIGIYISGSNIVVRHLTIQNIYQNQGTTAAATDAAGYFTADIWIDHGSPNISVYGNTLKNSRAGIWSDSSGTSMYYNNTLSDHSWQILLTGSGTPQVFGNTISDYLNWQFPLDSYHTDGIIVYGGSSVITPLIYDNTFSGDLGQGSPTGFVFCTYGDQGTGSGSSCTIFNNTFVGTGFTANNSAGIYFHSGNGTNPLGPHFVYNNTFTGFEYPVYAEADANVQFAIKNNVFNVGTGSYFIFTEGLNTFSQLSMDHNQFFGGRGFGPWHWNNQTFTQFADWQAACGCDGASAVGDPGLDPLLHPQANAAVIGRGAPLTSLGINQLNFDRSGTPRGSADSCAPGVSGCWDAGAFNWVNSATTVAPPTNLTAEVQ